MNKNSKTEKAVKRLIEKRPFGKMLLDKKNDKTSSIRYECEEILKYSLESILEYEYLNGELVGLIGFHISQYDTLIFKKKTAILKYLIIEEINYASEAKITESLLDKFNVWARENDIEVVIARIDSSFFNSIIVLQNHKYVFYETISYKTLSTAEIDFKNLLQVKFRFAAPGDLETIKKIALKNTFTKSHFYLDPKFPTSSTDLMYSNWIDNSFKSDDRIIVIEENTKIAGAFIYEVIDFGISLGSKRAIWKSAFIDQNFRKRGLGKKLFNAALKACQSEGVDRIDSSLVVKNIPSQNLHDSLNFKLVSVSYTFHKWFH